MDENGENNKQFTIFAAMLKNWQRSWNYWTV